MRGPPAGRSGRKECIPIPRHERLHDRMLGLIGLNKTDPVPGLPAGAPKHLVQQRKGSLGGARIALPQPQIGIHDADQVELRKAMALGDELSANDDIDITRRNGRQFLARTLDRNDEIAREHQQTAAGKQRGGFLVQSLHARAAGHQRAGRGAIGQLAGRGLAKPQ